MSPSAPKISLLCWRPFTTPLLEDKKECKNAPEEDDGAEVEREDEQPTVVQLKPGDIGAAEYEAYRQSMKGMFPLRDSIIVQKLMY